MSTNTFFSQYLNAVADNLCNVDHADLINVVTCLESVKKKKGKAIIVGNGGSAAIASHISVDLTKAANIRAINFNEADLLTCFANDYGYERWVEMALHFYADSNDLVVLISSSGQSPNIINGAQKALSMGLPLITCSGFDHKNPLRGLGQVNLWTNSSEYNIVETTHQIWLLTAIDFIASKDYSTNAE